ncbi:MAG: response regulator [Candidatus Xenobiia bacterium LiM19]
MVKKMSKILIVDDDESVVMELCQLLQNDAVQLSGTYSGTQALALVFNDLPDLLVLDMVMPDLTGYEVHETLAIHPETENLRVLFLVREPEKHRESAVRRKKNYQYIRKPFDPEEMKQKIDSMLGGLTPVSAGREQPAGGIPESSRDTITGLYLSSYLRQRLGEEVERARMHEYPLSLITAGITRSERFLTCKEGITHSLANEVAESIKVLSRVIDIPACTGDLKYTIILPRMEKSAALVFAQKLRNSLISQTYPPALDGAIASINLGVVQADPKKHYDGDTLSGELEGALQKARERGTNQIYMQER